MITEHEMGEGGGLVEFRGGAEQGRRQLTGMILVAATTGRTPSSGGNRCAVEGNCFSNYEEGSTYGNYEECTFRIDGIEGPLVFEQFDIYGYQGRCQDYGDFLTIAGTRYCGSRGWTNSNWAPTGLFGRPGNEISWHTDHTANMAGFKVCVAQCPSNCAAGSGCSWESSTGSCAVCPGEQNDRALESMSQ